MNKVDIARLLPYLEGRKKPTSWAGRGGMGLLHLMAGLYGGLQRLRALAYRRGWLPSYRAPCPVISIGNLASGGTGKTPLTLWLAQWCQSRGARVAVISRGYGQGAKQPVTVVADRRGIHLHPPLAADEAYLLARRLPGVTVLTGAERRRLIRLAVTEHQCDLILLDDGFQHLRVQRDLDLVLMDAALPLGNGFTLPGGILREPVSALSRCDGVILTRTASATAVAAARRQLQPWLTDQPLLAADHRPSGWRRWDDEAGPLLPLDALTGQAVVAFCGIARPDSFLALLTGAGIVPRAFHPFRDHQPYGAAELALLRASAEQTGAECLLCTEKDAVKLEAADLDRPLFYLELAFHFLEEPVWLMRAVTPFLPAPTASVAPTIGRCSDIPPSS